MSAAIDLINRGRDDAEAIAIHLLGPANKALSNNRELRWGEHGKFSMARSGGHKGLWRDWSDADRHGDALDLIERELQLDRTGALAWLKTWFGGSAPAIDHAKRQDEARADQVAIDRDKAAKVQSAGSMWRASVPLRGSPAERYLLDRLHGFQIPAAVYDGDALRWNPAARTFKREPVPGAIGAMIALMTDPATNEPAGIHRTFLDVAARKLDRGMLGDKGVCRLWPDDAVTGGLSLGEGIETTISAQLLFDAAPAWAALDAGNLAAFPVLSGIEALAIFADNDIEKRGRHAGQDAAQQCADRWLEAGREVVIRTPRQGETDFNDYLRRLGAEEAAA